MKSTFAYARLNARILPLTRGELYEDPLQEAFEKNGLGEVTGAGTMQLESGEIEYCGIDLDLFDLTKGVPFVCEFLTEQGAPKGSKLEYKSKGKTIEVPFGNAEGLALYLNGTDLPDEVYANCDINDLIDEINRLVGSGGSILGHWQGPKETALYMYGDSAKEMRACLKKLLAEHPLCQKARLV